MDLEVAPPVELVLPINDVNAAAGSHMGVEWGHGHSLTVYRNVAPNSRSVESTTSSQSTLHSVVWASSMHDTPHLRRLALESLHIFTNVQQQCSSDGMSKTKPNLMRLSLEYRALMRATRQELTAAANAADEEMGDSSADSDQMYLEAESQLLAVCELLWNLCEIMFIKPGTSQPILLLELVDWLRLHFPQGQQWAEEAAESIEPDQHPRFWDALTVLVLQGCTKEAADLLAFHSQSLSSSYQLLMKLLRCMPKAKFFHGHSSSQFTNTWVQWQSSMRTALEAGEFIDQREPRLEKLAELLSGDEEQLMSMEVLDLVENAWYHIFISHKLLTEPFESSRILNMDAERCMLTCAEMMGSDPSDQDRLVLLALRQDLGPLLREAAAHLHSWWFVAHLTDLLFYTVPELSQSLHCSSGLDMREFFLLEYAQSLISNSALWELALAYFDCCPVFGRSFCSALLERVPLDNERKALRVFRACEQRELVDEATGVCRVMWRRYLGADQLCNALSWAVRGRESSCVAQVAEIFLTEPQRRGTLVLADALECLRSAELLSNRLAFLVRYRELHKLLEAGRIRDAGNELTALLNSGAVARRFWPGLLLDVLPMLPQNIAGGQQKLSGKFEETFFSSEQVTQLIQCLQELLSNNKELANKLSTEQTHLLQIGLSKALSGAFMCESALH